MIRPLRAALLVAILAGACEGRETVRAGDEARRPRRGAEQPLIVGKPGEAVGLDPGRVFDDESVEICEQIFEHLVHYAPGTTEVVPELATSWDVDAAGTTWTFHLRPGVVFHDGTPFDADSVVFSFERQADPAHPQHEKDFGYWAEQYGYIQRVEAVDPLTVRITIARPYSPFLASLAMFPASIVSPTAVRRMGSAFARRPVGTGPFKLASWTPGDRIIVERNERYWGERPEVARIVFRTIPDPRQRLVALEGGAVDVAYSILPEELQYVKLHPDLRLHQIPVANVAYVAMNTIHPPFDDIEVRRAVNHAINKAPIVKLVYQGLAETAIGPLPPSMWGQNPDVRTYAYDPASARAVFAARVPPGQRFSLYVPSTRRPYLPDPELVGRVIQRNLADAGLTVDLVVQDLNSHFASVTAGKHDLCLFGWTADNGDPDNFLKVLLDSEADPTERRPDRNYANYRNPEVHALLRRAQETSDLAVRIRLYKQVQEDIARDAPWVPLAHSQVAVVARNEVEGLTLQPTALIYYRRVRLGR